jgi:hypothetical protein
MKQKLFFASCKEIVPHAMPTEDDSRAHHSNTQLNPPPPILARVLGIETKQSGLLSIHFQDERFPSCPGLGASNSHPHGHHPMFPFPTYLHYTVRSDQQYSKGVDRLELVPSC